MREDEYREQLSDMEDQIQELILKRARLMEWDRSGDDFAYFDEFTTVDSLEMDGVKILYQGVEGAYSHQAARSFFGRDADMSRIATFAGAMESVADGDVDYAVLPVENTTGGAVGDVLDLQMKYPCYAVADIRLPIQHVLLGLPGTKLEEVHTIYSHPQGIAQCQTFLEKHPQWDRVPMGNTAAAAKSVAETGDVHCVAIASELAGELYGLDILQRNIATQRGNTTRFLVFSGKKIYGAEANKVSICFECRHQTGNLYRLLAHLTIHGLNMTRIESRPIPGRNFEYRFFVEFEGNLQDQVVRQALNGIRRDTLKFRILGNIMEG